MRVRRHFSILRALFVSSRSNTITPRSCARFTVAPEEQVIRSHEVVVSRILATVGDEPQGFSVAAPARLLEVPLK